MATKSLKVKKGFIGAFQFTVCLNGMGKNPKEAWDDVLENVYGGCLDALPSPSETKLVDQEPWEE